MTKINNILIKFPMDKTYENEKLAISDSDYTFFRYFFGLFIFRLFAKIIYTRYYVNFNLILKPLFKWGPLKLCFFRADFPVSTLFPTASPPRLKHHEDKYKTRYSPKPKSICMLYGRMNKTNILANKMVCRVGEGMIPDCRTAQTPFSI